MKLLLPSEMYVELYAEMAEAMLNRSHYAQTNRLWKTEDNGDVRFTDEAQELYDGYCEVVFAVLEDVGIGQDEMLTCTEKMVVQTYGKPICVPKEQTQ